MTKEQPSIHVGIVVSKDKLAVPIAVVGVRDEVLSLGTFENAPASVDRLLKKLSVLGHLSRYAMRLAPQDMAFIGRCEHLVSNAVLSRLY